MKNDDSEKPPEVVTPDFGPRSFSEYSSDENSSSSHSIDDDISSQKFGEDINSHRYDYPFDVDFEEQLNNDDDLKDEKKHQTVHRSWTQRLRRCAHSSFDMDFKKTDSTSTKPSSLSQQKSEKQSKTESENIIPRESQKQDILKDSPRSHRRGFTRTIASRSMSRIETKSRNFLETLQTAKKALLPQGSYFFYNKREPSPDIEDTDRKRVNKKTADLAGIEEAKDDALEKMCPIDPKEKNSSIYNNYEHEKDNDDHEAEANDTVTLSTIAHTPQSSSGSFSPTTTVYENSQKSDTAFSTAATTSTVATKCETPTSTDALFDDVTSDFNVPIKPKDSTTDAKTSLLDNDVSDTNDTLVSPPSNFSCYSTKNIDSSVAHPVMLSPETAAMKSSTELPVLDPSCKTADISNEASTQETAEVITTDDEQIYLRGTSMESLEVGEPEVDCQRQSSINAPFPKPCFDTFSSSDKSKELVLLRKSSEQLDQIKTTDFTHGKNTLRSTSNFRVTRDVIKPSSIYRVPETPMYPNHQQQQQNHQQQQQNHQQQQQNHQKQQQNHQQQEQSHQQQQKQPSIVTQNTFGSYNDNGDQSNQQLIYVEETKGLGEKSSVTPSVSYMKDAPPTLPVAGLDKIISALPERVLFSNVSYTPVELQALAELREYVPEAPDEVLLRLLWYHQQEPLSQAVSHWSFLQEWMQTEHPKAYEVYQRYCNTGCLYAYGSSLWGHPVIICRVAAFLKIEPSFHILMAVHVIDVLRSQLLQPGKVEQVVMLVDMANCSLLEESLVIFVRGLNRLFCGLIAGWIFTQCDIATYVTLADFEEYETPLRVKFFYCTCSTIGQLICTNQLEQRYGGYAGNAERYDVFYSMNSYGNFSRGEKYFVINPIGATLPLLEDLPPLLRDTPDKGQISSNDLARAHTLIKHITRTLEKQKCLESFVFRILVHRAIFSVSTVSKDQKKNVLGDDSEVSQPNISLLPFEQVMIAKAQVFLTEIMMNSEEKQYASYIRKIHSGELHWLLLRCLYSTKGDFFATSYLVLLYLRSRKKKKNAKIWNASKALYCTNKHTLWGHPIIIFHVQRCLSFYFKRSVEDRAHALEVICGGVSSQLERIRQELDYGYIEQWLLLLNLENTLIYPCAESLECIMQVVDYIENMFPMYTAFLVLRKNEIEFTPPKRFESVTIRLTSDSDLSFWTSANLDLHFSTAGNTGGNSYNSILDGKNDNAQETLLPIEPVWYSIPLPYRRSPLNFLEYIAKRLNEYVFQEFSSSKTHADASSPKINNSPPPPLLPLASQLFEARLALSPNGPIVRSYTTSIDSARAKASDALTMSSRSRESLDRNVRNEPDVSLSCSNDSMVKLIAPGSRGSIQSHLKAAAGGGVAEGKLVLLKGVPVTADVSTIGTVAPQTLTPHGIPVQPQSGIAVSLSNAIGSTPPVLPTDLTRQVRGHDELRSNFEQLWYTNLQSKFEKQSSYDQRVITQPLVEYERSKLTSMIELASNSTITSEMKRDVGEIVGVMPVSLKSASLRGNVAVAFPGNKDEGLFNSTSPAAAVAAEAGVLMNSSDIAVRRKKKAVAAAGSGAAVSPPKNKVGLLIKRIMSLNGNNKFIKEFYVKPFLEKAEEDLSKAAKAYTEHLQWRNKRLSVIGVNELSNKLKSPKLCYVFGHDRELNPILISRLLCLQDYELPVAEDYVLFTVDKLLQELETQQQQNKNKENDTSNKPSAAPSKITVIVDVDGFSTTGLLSVGAKSFIKIIQENYPNRLNKMFIVNATSTFKMFWSVTIRTQLSQCTREKINILDNKYLEVLLKTVSKSQLEVTLGGKQPEAHFKPFQIPPLNIPASRFR